MNPFGPRGRESLHSPFIHGSLLIYQFFYLFFLFCYCFPPFCRVCVGSIRPAAIGRSVLFLGDAPNSLISCAIHVESAPCSAWRHGGVLVADGGHLGCLSVCWLVLSWCWARESSRELRVHGVWVRECVRGGGPGIEPRTPTAETAMSRVSINKPVARSNRARKISRVSCSCSCSCSGCCCCCWGFLKRARGSPISWLCGGAVQAKRLT